MDRTRGPPTRARADPSRDRCLRGLPHRPACRRWRVAAPAGSHHSRAPDRRPHRCVGGWCRRAADGRARRHPLVGPYLRPLRVLQDAAREPVRQPALHRRHTRWRLRHLDSGRCTLRVSTRRCRQRRVARAAALRRSDRLARAGHRRRGQAPGPLRLWRGRAHPGPGRRMAGPCGLRLDQARRSGDPGVRTQPWGDMGRRLRRDAPGAAGRSDHFRDVGRAGTARIEGGAQRQPGGLRSHPHERSPEPAGRPMSGAISGGNDGTPWP